MLAISNHRRDRDTEGQGELGSIQFSPRSEGNAVLTYARALTSHACRMVGRHHLKERYGHHWFMHFFQRP